MDTNILKTGTTCIGLKYKDGVMLAADNRVTTYKIESDKFTKLFDVTPNVVSTVAGYVSAAQLAMRHLKSEAKLIELKNEREARVREVASIMGSIQFSLVRQGLIVASIMGGYDKKEGPVLFDLGPDGTMREEEDYFTDGSGSIFTKSILDTEYRENLSEKEALEILERAFRAAFKNDNASGGGYIVKVVNKDGIKEVERKVVKSELSSVK